jgi:hypothetical protein
MSNKRQDDPKKIAALSAGIVVAVGFAGWSINNALNPPARAEDRTPNLPAAAADTGSPSEETAVAPAAGAAAPAQAEEGLDGTMGSVTVSRPAGGVVLPPEAVMAADVDPFTPLPPVVAPEPARPEPGVVLASSGAGGQRTGGWREESGPGWLPPAGPAGAPDVAIRAVVRAPEPAPKLMGTLLGDRPSAVFAGDRAMEVVPIGQTIGSWRVIKVEHGRVVLRHGKMTRHLGVAPPPAAGEVRVHAPEPAPAEMMAQMPAMDAKPVLVEHAKPESDEAPPESGSAAAPTAPPPPAPEPGITGSGG